MESVVHLLIIREQFHMAIALPVLRSGTLAWTTADLCTDLSWQQDAPAARDADIQRWDQGANQQDDPIQAWSWELLSLPAIATLARAIAQQITNGFGFSWVRNVAPGQAPELQRLVYLVIGSALGNILENYGRLYTVTNRGVCYKTQAVPVSMTDAATDFHTDSSARLVEPDIISLLCLQPGKTGGDSRLCSAITVHDYLEDTAPHLLKYLYEPMIRDVVTPGASRDLNCLRANAFPVFGPGQPLTFRYMRYWIEKGHKRANLPLSDGQLAALDALDQALEQPDHVQTFRMEKGDQLWVNNRCLAHDRRSYVDDPENPRTMVRMWIERS